MAFKCKIGLHNWNKCQCVNCNKETSSGHEWNLNKCIKCGMNKKEYFSIVFEKLFRLHKHKEFNYSTFTLKEIKILSDPYSAEEFLKYLLETFDYSEKYIQKKFFSIKLLGMYSYNFPHNSHFHDFSYEAKRIILTLGKSNDERVITYLIELLKDDNLQNEAAIALGELKNVKAVPALINALAYDERISEFEQRPHLRLNAARALGKIGDKLAINPLKDLLKKLEQKQYVYEYEGEAIAEALVILGQNDMIPTLNKYMSRTTKRRIAAQEDLMKF